MPQQIFLEMYSKKIITNVSNEGPASIFIISKKKLIHLNDQQ